VIGLAFWMHFVSQCVAHPCYVNFDGGLRLIQKNPNNVCIVYYNGITNIHPLLLADCQTRAKVRANIILRERK
jgi:hypothetical protein